MFFLFAELVAKQCLRVWTLHSLQALFESCDRLATGGGFTPPLTAMKGHATMKGKAVKDNKWMGGGMSCGWEKR